MDYALAGEPGDLWITAETQSKAKGSRGRDWQCQKGNLFASLLLTDPCDKSRLSDLTFIAAISVREAIEEFSHNQNAIQVKWPNDVMLNGRKCSGILLESVHQQDMTSVVIGIGVNCQHFPGETLHPATSLFAEGVEVSSNAFFLALSRKMAGNIALWNNGENFPAIRQKWLDHAYRLGETISVHMPGQDAQEVYGSVSVRQFTVPPSPQACWMQRLNMKGSHQIYHLQIYRAGDKIDIEPFEVEPVYVTHSIPEPVSLSIKTPLGRIIHTGDWKLDDDPTLGKNTDAKAFKRLGDDGVLALICDSTNAMRDGSSPTEREVSDSLANLISEAKGRVAITTFSSNVGRIRSIAQAAEKAGRKVMLVGSSIRRVVEVASDLNMFDDIQDFVEDIDFQYIDRNKLVIILTGSQGENRAALAKIARQEHRYITFAAGDTAKLGGEAGIPQVLPIRNGDLVRLAPGLAEIIDQVPYGRIYKDGEIIADEAATGVKERRKLSYAGHIAISIVLDRGGDMADDLDIALYGLPEITNDGISFDDALYKAAMSALSGIPKKRRKDDNLVREAVSRAVRSETRNLWGKKPITTVFVARV
ncbi:Ribonuclease J [Nymphon striatum]|nr:Ribonuclease J [Nymphon striatum]